MGELEVADGGVEWEGGRMVILATGSRNEINHAGGPIFLRLHLQMGFVRFCFYLNRIVNKLLIIKMDNVILHRAYTLIKPDWNNKQKVISSTLGIAYTAYPQIIDSPFEMIGRSIDHRFLFSNRFNISSSFD